MGMYAISARFPFSTSQKLFHGLNSMTTPPSPNRKLVVQTSEGDYGIVGVRTETSFPNEILMPGGALARLVRVTDRYVLYQEMAASAS